MADHSAIEWTGATWNPVTGCTKVSPGCANCYITTTVPFRVAGRMFRRVGNEETTGVVLHPERLDPGHRRYPAKLKPLEGPIFVCSLADLFHDAVPDEYIARVFTVISLCRGRTFQVLTKRPQRARDLLDSDRFLKLVRDHGARAVEFEWPLPNVWFGVSVENARFTWRANVLREIPAAVRFVSAEPLLGSLVNVPARPRQRGRPRRVGEMESESAKPLDLTGIEWLIAGGESGGRFTRPMDPDWARELRDSCRAAGVAFFFKQFGSHDENGVYRGPRAESGGRLLDGREWNELPAPAEKWTNPLRGMSRSHSGSHNNRSTRR